MTQVLFTIAHSLGVAHARGKDVLEIMPAIGLDQSQITKIMQKYRGQVARENKIAIGEL